MLLTSTLDLPLPTSNAQGFGTCWGVLQSPAPECCCVQEPFRLSQIWSLNGEEKGKKPQKTMLETFPTSHLLFTSTFRCMGLRWDQHPGVPEALPWLRAGRDGAATIQALCGSDGRASSQCHP